MRILALIATIILLIILCWMLFHTLLFPLAKFVFIIVLLYMFVKTFKYAYYGKAI